MDGWKPNYDGDEWQEENKEADEKIGKILGALQVAGETITHARDSHRWNIFKICLYALIAAGDSMMTEDKAIDLGDPSGDN